MPDSKITALTSILTSTDPVLDQMVIVDVSDTSMAGTGTTKRVSLNQLLGASGTATLASATITGDLTVDTNTLKVDSAGNRVIIGATIVPDTFLKTYTTDGTVGIGVGFSASAGYQGTWTNHPYVIAANGTEQLRIAPLGVFTFADGAGGTRMTLNSTGLGVGGSPTVKLDVSSTSTGIARFVNNLTSTYVTWKDGTSDVGYVGSGASFLSGLARTEFGIASAGSLVLGSNNARSVTIDTSGNVGIGVTPSAWGSTYKALQINTYGSFSATSTATNVASNWFWTGSANNYIATGFATLYQQISGTHAWYTAPSGTGGTGISFTQAMTLDASGNLLVGVTSTTTPGVGNTTAGASLNANGAAFFSHASSQALYLNTNVDGQIVSIRRSNVAVGSISVTTTATTFNSLSDYRLKEAVAPLSGGLARISALKPSVYKWKADGSNGEGFLAHELAEVVPLAVTGEKDAVNEDGSIKAQGVDLSKVVPVLVAAIQELAARVQTLETR